MMQTPSAVVYYTPLLGSITSADSGWGRSEGVCVRARACRVEAVLPPSLYPPSSSPSAVLSWN